jgi:hypothetical protein
VGDSTPPQEPPGPDGSPPRDEPRQRRLGLADDVWKTLAAVMIGVATLTGAWLTYTSVQIGDAAGGADARSTAEVVAIEQERTDAAVRVSAETAAVAQYRVMLAEADVIDGLPVEGLEIDAREDEARIRRVLAENFRVVSFDPTFLKGEGAEATYDIEGRIGALLRRDQVVAQMDPEATAAAAQRDHSRSVTLVGWVGALLGIVGLLSLAELVESRTRPPLVLIGLAGYVVVVVLAVGTVRGVA